MDWNYINSLGFNPYAAVTAPTQDELRSPRDQSTGAARSETLSRLPTRTSSSSSLSSRASTPDDSHIDSPLVQISYMRRGHSPSGEEPGGPDANRQRTEGYPSSFGESYRDLQYPSPIGTPSQLLDYYGNVGSSSGHPDAAAPITFGYAQYPAHPYAASGSASYFGEPSGSAHFGQHAMTEYSTPHDATQSRYPEYPPVSFALTPGGTAQFSETPLSGPGDSRAGADYGESSQGALPRQQQSYARPLDYPTFQTPPGAAPFGQQGYSPGLHYTIEDLPIEASAHANPSSANAPSSSAVNETSGEPLANWEWFVSPKGKRYKGLKEQYKLNTWRGAIDRPLRNGLSPSQMVDMMRQIVVDGISLRSVRPAAPNYLNARADFTKKSGMLYQAAALNAGVLSYIEQERELMRDTDCAAEEIPEEHELQAEGPTRLSRQYIESVYSVEVYRTHTFHSRRYRSVSTMVDALREIVEGGVSPKKTVPSSDQYFDAQGNWRATKVAFAYQHMLENMVVNEGNGLTLLDYFNAEKSLLAPNKRRGPTLPAELLEEASYQLGQGKSMRQVGTELGIGKSSMYLYFNADGSLTPYGLDIEFGVHTIFALRERLELLVKAFHLMHEQNITGAQAQRHMGGIGVRHYFDQDGFLRTQSRLVENLERAIAQLNDARQREEFQGKLNLMRHPASGSGEAERLHSTRWA